MKTPNPVSTCLMVGKLAVVMPNLSLPQWQAALAVAELRFRETAQLTEAMLDETWALLCKLLAPECAVEATPEAPWQAPQEAGTKQATSFPSQLLQDTAHRSSSSVWSMGPMALRFPSA